MNTLDQNYRRLRREHPMMRASQAVLWARHELRVDALERVIDWEMNTHNDAGPFAIGTMPDGTAIAVYWDDEVYDWGDMEPTEYERENLSVIGIVARVAGEDDELDSCWGHGFWDMSWERAALDFALDIGAFDTARDELLERTEWAARDVETV